MTSFWLPVYRLAAAALAPLAARRLGRGAAAGARQAERRGQVPEHAGELWLHAASVGEVTAAERLIRHLLDEDPERRIVVSTITHTGAAELARRLGDLDRLRHQFAPLDVGRYVRRWLARTRPAGLVLIETEIWPEMLVQCRREGIPVAMVSARLSARAFRRYRRFRGLFAHALSGVDPVLCQSEADRERFAALGVARDRLAVSGNLKFEPAGTGPPAEAIERWRRAFAARPVWVAGSTHPGEEAIIARAHLAVRTRVDNALLVIAPRHPERAPAVQRKLDAAGLTWCRPDDLAAHPAAAVMVVDRIGLLEALYRAADVCLVAGSLVPGIGGHNLLEPARAGKPVLAGPFLEGQQAAAEGLSTAGALVPVDAGMLADRVAGLLLDADRAAGLGGRARRWAERQRGALDATAQALDIWRAGFSRVRDPRAVDWRVRDPRAK